LDQLRAQVSEQAAHASKAGLTHCNAPLIVHVEQVDHSYPDPEEVSKQTAAHIVQHSWEW
jgi:hypothetical protein